MKKLLIAILIVVAIIFVIGIVLRQSPKTSTIINNTATTTVPAFDYSTSDGTVKVSYPSSEFGLAVNQVQVLVHPVIPPCEQGFNYCLYSTSTAYQGTNFISAGITVKKRADIANERLCLQTPPTGFSASKMPTATTTADTYSASRFSDVGQGAAGSFSHDTLYRLYYRPKNSCYEFLSRIALGDYSKYAPGTVKEFTSADEAALQNEINRIINSISLPNGETNLFP